MGSGGEVVLVVEQDPDIRDRVGAWLEADGLKVLLCPGPSQPDYTCIAARGMPCPIAQMANVVVLDLWLASDRSLAGTSSIQLLSYYAASEKPVVALSARRDQNRVFKLFAEDPVYVVDWPPERRDLCETVRAVLHRPAPSS
jgi:DNA-binding response OmpR family regulator